MKNKKKKAQSKGSQSHQQGRLHDLEEEVRHQTDELKSKEKKLKQVENKQKLSNQKILLQREQLLHVTRVGKLAEFVSSLAHEISQPLTAILSYAQAAQRMLDQREPEVKEILQHIITDNQRASAVIRRLRSLLKKGKPKVDLIDVGELINETILLITTDITVRHKTIEIQLAENLPSVYGDRVQLQQVLLNLISNSLDAMEGIDDARELFVKARMKNPNMVMIEVQDSGCGVPEENLDKLFTHFFTSKPDGLGMGLSISRSIVEAHGGDLTVRNNPDRGATFSFTILADKKEKS